MKKNSAGKIPSFYRKCFQNFQVVLVLAGIESIFFTVAVTGLCFRFVLKTVYNIEMFFVIAEQDLHRAKAILDCHIGKEVGNEWEVKRRLRWLQVTQGVFQTIRHHTQYIK